MPQWVGCGHQDPPGNAPRASPQDLPPNAVRPGYEIAAHARSSLEATRGGKGPRCNDPIRPAPRNPPPDSFFFGSCLASRFRSLSGQGEEVLAPARSCGAVVFTLTRKGVLHVLARPGGPDGVPCRATRSRRAASPLWHPRLGLRSDRPPPLARASRWRWLAGGVRCAGQTNLHDDACERAWVCR